jgi:hypothetical protein
LPNFMAGLPEALESVRKLDGNPIHNVEQNLWGALLIFKAFDIKVASFR